MHPSMTKNGIIGYLRCECKVKLPALPRGASVAKPSGTPPKPPAVTTLWRGKPVFVLRATPRSPVAVLSGRSLGEDRSSPCYHTGHPGEGEWGSRSWAFSLGLLPEVEKGGLMITLGRLW